MLSAAYPTAGLSQHISRSNRESGRSNYQDVLQRSRRTLRSSCSSRPSRVADDLLSRPSTRAGYEVSTTRKHRKSTRSRLSATGKDINPKCSPLEHYRPARYIPKGQEGMKPTKSRMPAAKELQKSTVSGLMHGTSVKWRVPFPCRPVRHN